MVRISFTKNNTHKNTQKLHRKIMWTYITTTPGLKDNTNKIKIQVTDSKKL